MLEKEILKQVIHRTENMVVFELDSDVRIEVYHDGTVVKSKKVGKSFMPIPLYENDTDKAFHFVRLRSNGQEITIGRARLITLAFHGVPESEFCCIRFIDGNYKNQSADNVEFATYRQQFCILDLISKLKKYQININRGISVQDYVELEKQGLVFFNSLSEDKLQDNLVKVASYINGDVFNIEAIEEYRADSGGILTSNIF
ncbi:hypothetical protein [Ruminiclostridium josui]|uniref:hypothetical protein n=1 Tax=Ruminiclostridium josui TaxID=1499 RepID=UPI000465D4E5|nr:hypothetical protein [Ruminiclostridium josui]